MELTSRLGEYGSTGSAGRVGWAEEIETSASTTKGEQLIGSFLIKVLNPESLFDLIR